MTKKYSQISSDILAKNPYWVYKKDIYTLPDYSIGEYHYVETSGSVVIIPLYSFDKIIMVNQYRYLNQRFSLEFPGGGNKSTLSIEENAQKELSEEAGVYSNKIIKIGEFNPYIGVTNEICNVYIALDLINKKINADNSEEFEIMTFTKKEIDGKISSGEIWNGMTLAAWALFNNSINYLEEFTYV